MSKWSGSVAAAKPLVGIIMGSKSDWTTMKCALEPIEQEGIAYEVRVVSAHRTPKWLYEYASSASARGLKCVIAGAGGAAHLPGMTAALTSVPVLGVPVRSREMEGLDSVLSILQMPTGIPVATFPIGETGARQAGEFAVRILKLSIGEN